MAHGHETKGGAIGADGQSDHASLPFGFVQDPGLPQAQGLYSPQREHDACGVGFVAHGPSLTERPAPIVGPGREQEQVR